MPPNRKGIFDLTDSVVTLSVADVDVSQPIAKFPPLTSLDDSTPAKEAQAREHWDAEPQQKEVKTITAKHTSDATHPLQSYWDWDTSGLTKDVSTKLTIANILEEEKNRQLLSVQQVEEQLLKNKIISNDESKEENDSYWDWGNDKDDDRTPSYWDWPTLSPEEEKNSAIQLIVEAEKIREQLMTEKIQEQLVKSTCGASQQQIVSAQPAEEPSYWDW